MKTLTQFVIALLISFVLAFNGVAGSAEPWQGKDKKEPERPVEKDKKEPKNDDKKDKKDDKKKPDFGG